jgi:hypothetical protein
MLSLWRGRASSLLHGPCNITKNKNPIALHRYYTQQLTEKAKEKREKKWSSAMIFKDTAQKFRQNVARTRNSAQVVEVQKREKRTEEQKLVKEEKRQEKKQQQQEIEKSSDEYKVSFVERHVVTILYRYFEHLQNSPNAPLDSFVNQYMRRTSGIGMHNRHTISNTVYDIMRWHLILSYIVKHAQDQLAKPQEVFRMQQRLHTQNMRSILHKTQVELDRKMRSLSKQKKKYGVDSKRKQKVDDRMGEAAREESEVSKKISEPFLDKTVQEDILQMRLKYHIYLAIKQRLSSLDRYVHKFIITNNM